MAYVENLRKLANAPASSAASSEVVLFSAVWCAYCKQAKDYLASKAVAYREVDIDTKDGMVAFAQAGGQKSVPLLLANGRRVLGFSAAGYDAALIAQK
jgi:glutaredoxin